MPLYEYVCKSCGNRYEKIQKVDDAPDVACPKCGGEVERPLSTPAFQFKGSGWYITDYAKSGGSKPAASASSDSSSSTASKPASSESKSSDSSSSTSGSSSSSSSSSSTPAK